MCACVGESLGWSHEQTGCLFTWIIANHCSASFNCNTLELLTVSETLFTMFKPKGLVNRSMLSEGMGPNLQQVPHVGEHRVVGRKT